MSTKTYSYDDIHELSNLAEEQLDDSADKYFQRTSREESDILDKILQKVEESTNELLSWNVRQAIIQAKEVLNSLEDVGGAVNKEKELPIIKELEEQLDLPKNKRNYQKMVKLEKVLRELIIIKELEEQLDLPTDKRDYYKMSRYVRALRHDNRYENFPRFRGRK